MACGKDAAKVNCMRLKGCMMRLWRSKKRLTVLPRKE